MAFIRKNAYEILLQVAKSSDATTMIESDEEFLYSKFSNITAIRKSSNDELLQGTKSYNVPRKIQKYEE